MTGAQLLEEYEASLSHRLPRHHVDEVLDGLCETYNAHRSEMADEDAAVRAAIRDFGDTDIIVAEFVRQSAGRRLARILLASGPLVGLFWAITLISDSGWTPHAPSPLLAGIASILVTTVVTLMATAVEATDYRRARTTARIGAVALLVLDVGMICAAVALSGSAMWALVVALAMSSVRAGFVLRSLPVLISD